MDNCRTAQGSRKIPLPHPRLPRLRHHFPVSPRNRLRIRRFTSQASPPRLGQLRRHRHRSRIHQLSRVTDPTNPRCEPRWQLVRGAGGGQGREEAVPGGKESRSELCVCGEHERLHCQQGESCCRSQQIRHLKSDPCRVRFVPGYPNCNLLCLQSRRPPAYPLPRRRMGLSIVASICILIVSRRSRSRSRYRSCRSSHPRQLHQPRRHRHANDPAVSRPPGLDLDVAGRSHAQAHFYSRRVSWGNCFSSGGREFVCHWDGSAD